MLTEFKDFLQRSEEDAVTDEERRHGELLAALESLGR